MWLLNHLKSVHGKIAARLPLKCSQRLKMTGHAVPIVPIDPNSMVLSIPSLLLNL